MELLYKIGYFLTISIILNAFGNCFKKLRHLLLIISSVVYPFPPNVLGKRDRQALQSKLVFIIAPEISAF